jgi:outer membrane receptor protein involved in Fe transport
MNMRLKAALVAGVSLNVIGVWAGAACAAENAAIAAAAAPASEAAASSSSVAEVIVTAQRRAESTQTVPMTLQALTGETLQKLNVATLNDLLKFTPNVTFGTNGPGQTSIFMRGLSSGFRGSQSQGTVGNFPNVAIYLDDQSMQFPARAVDVYMADMDRVEVLEGPQGTLFGGGAEAGAVRYITNKPKLNVFEANAEAAYGFTSGGDPNTAINAMINVPLMQDKLAVRAVIYNERQGGYITNVPSTFTRSNQDLGNYYFNIAPTNGICPNGLPAGPTGCTLPASKAPQANNAQLAGKASNPTTFNGARFEARYEVNEDWEALIAQSFSNLDAEGLSVQYPTGSDFQPLKPWENTAFAPSYNKDKWQNTAWTLNGKLGQLHVLYTGGYTNRHIQQQLDYTNYSRTGAGIYYACVGGSTGWGAGPASCYSPVTYWQDDIRNTHLSNEIRISSPDDWRTRFIVGAYHEKFRIYDNMNFNYRTIPSCNPANLQAALAGGPICVANLIPAPGSTTNDPSIRSDVTGFGEDVQRGYNQLAFFGSVDFDIIPKVLTFTAGTRWYKYDTFEVGSQYQTSTACMNVPNGQCGPAGYVNIDSHNDDASYKGFKSAVGITWHVNSTTMAYFRFSQGFRPGGFNRSQKLVLTDAAGQKQFLEPNAYAPDTLNNYEVGVKTTLFDGRMLFNLSAYNMDWKNTQFALFSPPYGINTTFNINGPSYNVKGVEAQIVARATDNLTVDGSVTYNNNTQTDAPCLTDNVAGTAAFGQCITEATPKGGVVGPIQNPFGAPGSVPAFAPKWHGNIRVRYDWDVQEYRPYAWVGASYVSSMWNQPATYTSGEGVVVPNTTYLRYFQPGYATLDAAVGVSRDNWYAELYGTNLTNNNASTFTSSAQFIKSEVPLRPAVVMLKFGVHY